MILMIQNPIFACVRLCIRRLKTNDLEEEND
jgi:hypothetical protein